MNKNQKENIEILKEFVNTGNTENQNSESIEKRIDEILAVLDLEVEIPENLVEKVMERKNSIQSAGRTGIDFSKYLQIAAVFAAAVLLGVLLGKNADVHTFNKKQSREDRALLELKEKHHLSEDYSFGKL